jgi:creatinine amidohydrolase
VAPVSYVDFSALTWPEAEQLGRGRTLGVICLAALEQHGPALPLSTDTLIGAEVARRLADAFVEPVAVLPVPWGGRSDHHLGFPGSVTLDAATLRGIVDAYVDALVRTGIRDVFVFTSHGGNFGFLTELAAAYAGRDDVRLAVYDDRDAYFGVTFVGARRAGFDPPETDWHAGGIETSQGLHAFPELVRPFDGIDGYLAAEPGWLDRVLSDGIRSVSENGILGSPRGASAEAGAAVFDALVELLAGRVESVFGLTRR